jgi:hypothetical protein
MEVKTNIDEDKGIETIDSKEEENSKIYWEVDIE